MRTVILVGLTSIADAIRKDWATPLTIKFCAYLFLIVIIMDIWEFINKTFKK